MTFNRRILLQSAALSAVIPGLSTAQPAWPAKPVTMVVPFPAGCGTDAFARPLSAQFSKATGKQLIIDNKGGAGGTVGASFAAKAANDGYTFFMGAVHHAITPSMYPKLDYNIETDLVPLLLAAVVPQVLVVNPNKVPANDLKEFLTFVKKNPGKLNYGCASAGTSHHPAGELFKLQTKTFITHILYRGAGPTRLHHCGVVWHLGQQRHAARCANPRNTRVSQSVRQRRTQGYLGQPRRRVCGYHACAIRSIFECRHQALGCRGQGFGCQA